METLYKNRALIIITATDRDAANEDAQALDPAGGGDTFSVPLSPTGDAPATHYACSVACTDAQRGQIIALQAAKYPEATLVWYDLDEEPDTPAQVFAGLGLMNMSGETV